ncbi:hypothetical protein [Streptomyces sp. NPDC048428]|uniref:hypothetical protein n=1 Tax=Streptomyces sp. NPDC048428 TaxID=3154503 RepID=UPI003430102F
MSTAQTDMSDQAARKGMAAHLIPVLMVVYFVADIDKANIARCLRQGARALGRTSGPADR